MNSSKGLLVLTGLVLAACGSGSTPAGSAEDATKGADTENLSVVVTTTVWGDIVSNIMKGDGNVEVLFPIGADAHDFQVSSAQAAAMREADLVIVNGLELEEGILDVIESLGAEGANIFEVAPMLDPIAYGAAGHSHDGEEGEHTDEEEGEHTDEEEGEHTDESASTVGGCTLSAGHEQGGCDPHVWMDPLRVATAVELIAETLTGLYPNGDWTTNANVYAGSLRALDEMIIAMLAVVPEDRRKMVTNHGAFGYFAERYGFEVVGVVFPGGSALATPSSAELAELVAIMGEEDIDVIFGETVEPSALADAVGAEVGAHVEVVELFTESLGRSGSGAETYIDMVRTNAARVASALS